MKNTNKNEDGIVLIEAIVAVGVLATIFTATMALYLSSIKGVRMTNDRLIATYLAQDAMEQVIAKRQYNYLNYEEITTPLGGDGGWLDDLAGCSGKCTVDYINNNMNSSDALNTCTTACDLYTDGTEYSVIDGGSGWSQSYFDRWITVTRSGDEARVTAVVSWKDGDSPMQYSINYNIYRNPNIK